MTKTCTSRPLTTCLYQTPCQVQIGAANIKYLLTKIDQEELNDLTQIQRQ